MNSPTHARRMQFGIASMLAWTTLVGLFIALVVQFTFYPINLYVIGIFVSVLASQLLLFRGKRPRIASVLAGFLFTLILMVYLTVNFNLKFGYRYDWNAVGWDIQQCAFLAFLGGILGYILGLFMNGVFLVARKMQSPVKEASANAIGDELS